MPSSPRATASRRRWPTVLLAALAVVAVLAPVAWLLDRPSSSAGVPLSQALAASPEPSPAPSTDLAPTGPAEVSSEPAAPPASASTAAQVPGEVATRDASLGALPARGPAPARLQVPSLGIDAAVDAVGVQEDGAMVVPAEVDRVGWYRFGPEPGAAEGNAVLAGHVDTIAQGAGALFELREVGVGAEITVTDAAGAVHAYEVVSRERITKTDLPVEQIFARTGEPRLVVITCGGDYLPGSRRYADNVVVTAVPVDRP